MFGTTSPSALRAARSQTWASISSSVGAQRRLLSASSALRASEIISFQSTGSRQLNEDLNTFREKFILPTYLTQEEQKKMHSPKWKDKLQRDPFRLEIDGVVHKFYYVDKITGYPNTKELFTRILNRMKKPSYIANNLMPLLQGLKRAQRKLDPTMWPKIVRKAALAGSLDTVIRCIQHADKTGFRLSTSETISELLCYIQQPAIENDFKRTKVESALKKIQTVLDLLEGERDIHKPTPDSEGRYPFYRDPQFLAARLHMAAALAVHHKEGKDKNGRVTKYAEELVRLWPEGAGLLDLQPDLSYKNKEKMAYLLDRNEYLWVASPILNGLNLAAQVVDPGLAMQLQNRADAVESEVRVALAAEDRKKGGRGEIIYNKLFNPRASQEEAAEED
ncbi:hypothetical protein MFIFM68171_10899 [Madurella fahalii]|uniref:Uncharacterized protein n=1 Tax=Madurella fahalii TaxID=1157608 RepID=A0ABQ0GSI8_9PEZI